MSQPERTRICNACHAAIMTQLHAAVHTTMTNNVQNKSKSHTSISWDNMATKRDNYTKVRPIPPHNEHVSSSRNKNVDVTPSPPHRQHSRPPMRGSPGRSIVAPGGALFAPRTFVGTFCRGSRYGLIATPPPATGMTRGLATPV